MKTLPLLALLLTICPLVSSAQASDWDEARHKLELGDDYLAEQRVDDACRSYAAATRIAPDWWMTFYKLGACLETQGKQPQEILPVFDKALAISPDQEILLLAIGRVYEQAQDWTRAEEYYRRSMAKGGDDTNALTHLGGVFIEQKNWAKAMEVLEQAAAQGSSPELLSQLARLYRVTGNRKKEEEVLRKLLEQRPGGAGESSERLDQILVETGRGGELSRHKLQLGEEFLSQGRVLEACEAFRKGAELAPTWWEPLLKLGLCLEKAGRPGPEVVEQLELALQRSPGLFIILKTLSRVLLTQGSWTRAEEVLREALLAAPGEPEILVRLGIVLMAQSRWDEARPILERAAASRNDPVAWHHLAQLYRIVGNTSREEDILRKLIVIAPDPAPYASRLGAIFIQTGRLGQAESLARWLSTSRRENRYRP